MKKKTLIILISICIFMGLLTAPVFAAESQCAPDQHNFKLVEGNNYRCETCQTTATLINDVNGLQNAVSGANSGDILLLNEGTYTLNSAINITSSNSGLIIVGIGSDETKTIIQANTKNIHMFYVHDEAGCSPRPELTLVNLTLDRNNKAKAAVDIREEGIANLYHVTVKGGDNNGGYGWKALQIDNGYNTPGAISEINAYDVEMIGETIVKIGAFNNTYAKLNYDSNCNITDVIYDFRGDDVDNQKHITISKIIVNGAPLDSAVASVKYNDGTEVGYRSLADAIAVVNNSTVLDGNYTVTLLKDCAENVTIEQREGVNITVTANKDVIFTGKFTVDGNSRSSGKETLTFESIVFDGSRYTDYHYFIEQNSQESEKLYPHNITVKNCTFLDDDHYVTAIRVRQGFNIKVEACTQTGGFQFLWATGGSSTHTIDNINVVGVTEGINLGSGASYNIAKAIIQAEDFGIRVGAAGETLGKNVTVNECTITSQQSFVIRGNAPTEGFTLSVLNSKMNDTLKDSDTNKQAIKNAAGPYQGLTEIDAENFSRFNVANWTGIIISSTNNQNAHTITYNSMDGTTVDSDMVYTNEKLQEPNNPTKTGYKFDGWYKEFECVTKWDYNTDTVSKDAILYAKWIPENYEVNVTVNPNEGGTVSGTGPYNYGDEVTLTVTTSSGYSFINWTENGTELATNPIYKFTAETARNLVANFALNNYLVTWYDEDGTTVLESKEWAYGTTPIYNNGQNPTKTSTSGQVYTFAGWSPAVTTVTGSAYYTATFTDETRTYTVTWYDEDGITVLESAEWPYGSVPSFTGTIPTKTVDEEYTYTFKEWVAISGFDKDGKLIGPASYKAFYTATEINTNENEDDGKGDIQPPSGSIYIPPSISEDNPKDIVCTRDENCPMMKYSDMDINGWYHEGVHYCIENGLMTGIGADTFAPNMETNRAMLVTILWRLEGSPKVDYLLDFDDVAADQWYSQAIRWAASEDIIGGYGNGKFGPTDILTREQFAGIMFNYAQYKGYDVSVWENTNILSYDDAFDVAEWAMHSMQWACGSGLISGIADGDKLNLAPQGSATRAQAATMLYRFCETIIK